MVVMYLNDNKVLIDDVGCIHSRSTEFAISPDAPTCFHGCIGEEKIINLGLSGVPSKATFQSYGWAVCDGTTATSQGISDAIIENTPNNQHRIIRMSNNETSGSIGGSDTHTLTIDEMPAHTHSYNMSISIGTGDRVRKGDGLDSSLNSSSTGGGNPHNNIPAYIEKVIFIKVK